MAFPLVLCFLTGGIWQAIIYACLLLSSFSGEMSCIPCQPVCSSASQDRAGTNSPLSFEVVGGWELGHPIFVSTVEPNSIPERAGLRVGDQVSVSFLYSVWEVGQFLSFGQFPLPFCINGLESSFFSCLLRSISLQILEINDAKCVKKELREVSWICGVIMLVGWFVE